VTGSQFEPGQVVTVFRSSLLEEPDERYEALNVELGRRAHELGGLVDLKSFVADDGERVTLVTFEDAESHARWATDPGHRRAQQLGRSSVYASYSIQVASCTRVATFDAEER
jgi:heme-degrading monooxygenase HmoA